jgi:hypothetical protein
MVKKKARKKQRVGKKKPKVYIKNKNNLRKRVIKKYY